MEPASEGENRDGNNNKNDCGEELAKPKRKMKTPFQLESLEKTYAAEPYPSEAVRAELSEKLGLSDRQLQMWFCHRRLKDKKEALVNKARVKVQTTLEPGSEHVSRSGPGSGSGSGSGSSLIGRKRWRGLSGRVGVGATMVEDNETMAQTYHESSQSIVEQRAIALIEAQLGEPLREDGPILGMEFDPLPPDAFGNPLEYVELQKQPGSPLMCRTYEQHDVGSNKAATRPFNEYKFLRDQSNMRSDIYGGAAASHSYDLAVDGYNAKTSSLVHGNGHLSGALGVRRNVSRDHRSLAQDKEEQNYSSSPGSNDCIPQKSSFMNCEGNVADSRIGPENPIISSGRKLSFSEDILRMKRKREIEEVQIAKVTEAHEKRIKKELEKQDVWRQKRVEQMRKEMEKHDREKRREEVRLMRERQRAEKISQRKQKREIKRREKVLQKEYLRAEKRRKKEELRREKEAARHKAAAERAAARRIARESKGLVEDEQLELVELAASSKGLPSIISLEDATLRNLESFKDVLGAFPPKSVKLKRPFAIEPWIDSEANIGNLFMVWQFLIHFADVLELWPFTLDEFIQSFHDHDSRLLCEVHVALLKVMIKDIEDVRRIPPIGMGLNQNSIANPDGGHPLIVEGAHAWGFDTRNWKQHLNSLTWPEILRQFALSAGFGPHLKKRSIEPADFRDNTEVNGCEDIISNLRNGSAAESAAAMMQVKGFSISRRPRHRLTPGTVKFAAFHVLSLEGSRGLTILELAEKIQKSGLRDLTRSKAPEASIAAALSRDAKLFERTAPSTYCVRSAYRKDPADADSVLSAAREKLKIFENGFVVGEDGDVFGRDEDSECEAGEASDIDDQGTPINANKNADCHIELNTCSGNGKDIFYGDVSVNMQNEFDGVGKDSSLLLDGSKDADGPTIDHRTSGKGIVACNLDLENTEIDECKAHEPWVQGLTEGEYSGLSVEERLNALVALVGVVNEGNSIRTVLEDRLEAANALKKRMWAEAQLDKRRVKEESITRLHNPSSVGCKAEIKVANFVAEGCQSPLLPEYKKRKEESLSPEAKQEPVAGVESAQNNLDSFPTERTAAEQDFIAAPNSHSYQQQKYAVERSRSQLKSYIAHRAEEMYVYRSLPLGQDRRHNRYWQFIVSPSKNDPGAGRVFIESNDGHWWLIDSEEAFDALLKSLDARGIREFHLLSMLQKIETSFKENVQRNLQCTSFVSQNESIFENEVSEMGMSFHCTPSIDNPSSTVCGLNSDKLESSSTFKIQLGKNEAERKAAWKRYEDFQKWMWQESLISLTLCAKKYGTERCSQILGTCDLCLDSYHSEGNHCFSCHKTFDRFNYLNFLEHVIQCKEKRKVDSWNLRVVNTSYPTGTNLLMALLAFIEVSIPSEALQSSWESCRKTWGRKLHTSSSIEDLLQALTMLEGAIKKDWLLSDFETTNELLNSCTLSGTTGFDSACSEPLPVLPWIPQTTAAVALRLLELDASILYKRHLETESQEDPEKRGSMKFPSGYSPFTNILKVEPTEVAKDGHIEVDNWPVQVNKHNSTRCGRGGRGRGRGRMLSSRWQKTSGSRSEVARLNARDNGNIIKKPIQQGRKTHAQVCGWGRRVNRRQRAESRTIEEKLPGLLGDAVSPYSKGVSPGYQDRRKWGGKEIRMMATDDADNSSAEGESDDDAQAMESEHRNWGLDFDGMPNGRTGSSVEVSDENVEGFEEDYDDGEEEAEDSEEGMGVNEGSDDERNGDVMEDEVTESADSGTSSD